MSIDPPAFAIANNMSCVNALHALLEHAQSLENAKSLENPKSKGLMNTPDKVVDFLKKQNHLYVRHFDGQFIGVGFRYFPYLATVGYDMYHGTGAAKRALEEYSKIPTDKRFDKNDHCRFSDIRIPTAKL